VHRPTSVDHVVNTISRRLRSLFDVVLPTLLYRAVLQLLTLVSWSWSSDHNRLSLDTDSLISTLPAYRAVYCWRAASASTLQTMSNLIITNTKCPWGKLESLFSIPNADLYWKSLSNSTGIPYYRPYLQVYFLQRCCCYKSIFY